MNSRDKRYSPRIFTDFHGERKGNRSLSSCGLWLIILIFFLVSCNSQKLDTHELKIERDGVVLATVKTEIARTPEERAKGLMHRQNLPEGQGMFFIFEKDEILSFWMKNTLIPLSIAFISSDGRIIDIKDMHPNDRSSVLSSRSVRYALEVPQGWFLKKGIREGDRINFGSIR